MPTVLITGANRGLGLEFVHQYAAAGWCVQACCRSLESSADMQAVEGDVHLHQLDCLDLASIAALGEKLAPRPLDLVIANAGRMQLDMQADSMDPAAWLDDMRVNALAPVMLARTFRPHLLKARTRKLIAITSRMGSIGDNSSGGLIGYRMSKAALNMGWRTLAMEWKADDMTLALLHPGWVQTAMGGPQAQITAQESVAGLRAVIDQLGPGDSGSFWSYKGEPLPW